MARFRQKIIIGKNAKRGGKVKGTGTGRPRHLKRRHEKNRSFKTPTPGNKGKKRDARTRNKGGCPTLQNKSLNKKPVHTFESPCKKQGRMDEKLKKRGGGRQKTVKGSGSNRLFERSWCLQKNMKTYLNNDNRGSEWAGVPPFKERVWS